MPRVGSKESILGGGLIVTDFRDCLISMTA